MKMADTPKMPEIRPISAPDAPKDATYRGSVGNKQWKLANNRPLAIMIAKKRLVHNGAFVMKSNPF